MDANQQGLFGRAVKKLHSHRFALANMVSQRPDRVGVQDQDLSQDD
jgi:hypothetical protein